MQVSRIYLEYIYQAMHGISDTHKEELTEHKLKGTRSRFAVLHILTEENKPLDVAEIIDNLKKHAVDADQATVYRILDKFTEHGIIERLEFQEGKFRYEKAGRREHHHLICDNCGQIEDISDCKIEEFQSSIAKKKKFFIKRHTLEFFGLCQLCQQ